MKEVPVLTSGRDEREEGRRRESIPYSDSVMIETIELNNRISNFTCEERRESEQVEERNSSSEEAAGEVCEDVRGTGHLCIFLWKCILIVLRKVE